MKKSMIKKTAIAAAILCCMLAAAGCSTAAENTEETPSSAVSAVTSETQSDTAATAATVKPLEDTTMDNLTDATLAVSLEKGDAYVDDAGALQMDVKIYSYDKYDLVEISNLKAGDTLVTHSGNVTITSLETDETGVLHINGGLENDGLDLITEENGIYFVTGYDDAKDWYEVGEATLRVSADFLGHDKADEDKGDVVFYPGSFLNDEITDYNFTPNNTTVRVEGGQVVEMNRIYQP